MDKRCLNMVLIYFVPRDKIDIYKKLLWETSYLVDNCSEEIKDYCKWLDNNHQVDNETAENYRRRISPSAYDWFKDLMGGPIEAIELILLQNTNLKERRKREIKQIEYESEMPFLLSTILFLLLICLLIDKM